MIPAWPRGNENAARPRKTNGVANQIVEDTAQQIRVRVQGQLRRTATQLQALLGRSGSQCAQNVVDQCLDRDIAALRRYDASIKPGNIQHRIEQRIKRPRRRLHAFNGWQQHVADVVRLLPQPLFQRSNVERKRVSWLPQVVAGGSEEAGLGIVGRLRLTGAQCERLRRPRDFILQPGAGAVDGVHHAIEIGSKLAQLSTSAFLDTHSKVVSRYP